MCFVQVVKRLLPLAENVIEIELMKGNKGKLGYVMDSSINCDFFFSVAFASFCFTCVSLCCFIGSQFNGLLAFLVTFK